MPVPVPDTNAVASALALLTSRFKNAPNLRGLITALAERLAEIEADYWSFIYAVQLSNHPLGTFNGFTSTAWDMLDKLGAIVGETRDGRNDTDFLAAIKIQIRVNRSRGTGVDVLAVALLVAGNALYRNWGGGEWEVQALNTTPAVVAALKADLGRAGANGTRGTLRYTLDARPPITWTSVHAPAPSNALGFADSYSATFANNVPCALEPVT